DDPRPQPLGDPNHGPEVLGVLDLVQDQQEALPLRPGHGFLLPGVLPDRQARDRPLVRPRQPIDRPTLAVADQNARLAAQAFDLVDAAVVALRIEHDPLDLPRAGAQGLDDRVQAGEDHVSLAARRTMAMTARPSPRPVKPRPLELVPRTLTEPGGTPRRSARRR